MKGRAVSVILIFLCLYLSPLVWPDNGSGISPIQSTVQDNDNSSTEELRSSKGGEEEVKESDKDTGTELEFEFDKEQER
jgi:hypothetical protein